MKPKKYEEKKLGSEKSADKKFGAVRKFTQNTVTKFNWNFNAKNKLDLVISRAKAAYKDDYTRLLSFYNYDLSQTQQFKSDLDSVIYKANAGILIHDLRNSWIDNLYLLMGQAYYYKNELDTAYLTFQYINYAFSPREKDGYDIPIGSNATEGGNAFSVSTKEKKGLPNKVWARPPSRNESFIWQIRTYLAKNETAEAAGLIETLKGDPFFPARLSPELYEMQAYYFYKQEIYDSAAVYLEKALSNAENGEEKARWEYLIGQLYERAGEPMLARDYFERTTKHTFNPVLELYARLNATRQDKSNDKVVADNIEAVVRMARKDRYRTYQDIIYFTAATMELERKNVEGARQLLLRAISVLQIEKGSSQRTKAFTLLGDLSFELHQYRDAKRFYDSVDITDPTIGDVALLQQRKVILLPIVEHLGVIERQDSLQRIAMLPETERDVLIKKMVKQMRKTQGIKEESTEGAGANSINKTAAPPDLFNNSKGEWYFDNASLKSKGFTEFRGKWGNRPNVDNWRRSGAISRVNGPKEENEAAMGKDAPGAGTTTSDVSYEGLMKSLPLTPDLMKISNDSIEKATFQLGKIYFESLEDYPGAITTLEGLLTRYPATIHKPEALFILNYCYNKTGNAAKANEMRLALEQQYAGSEYQKMVTNPAGGTQKSKAEADMNRRYESIYISFIEGRFDQALSDKKIADSLYGTHYWTPQLLYIQSVYHIKQKQDDQAKVVLQQIIQLYPTSPLSPRARTMLDVLGRRREIEDYLTNLKIERPGEDSALVITNDPVIKKVIVEAPPVVPVDSAATRQADSLLAIQKLEDGLKARVGGVVPVPAGPKDSINPSFKVGAITMVDTFSRKIPGFKPDTAATSVDSNLVKNDPDPVKIAPTLPPTVNRPADSLATNKPKFPGDSMIAIQPKLRADSAVAIKPNLPAINSVYSVDAEGQHMVIMILDKVDPVYVGEAKNAFNRYNKQNYFNLPIETTNQPLTDSLNLVVITPFPNAASALDYTRKTAEIAETRIIPWMPKGKFSFLVITPANLQLLQNRKDLSEYLRFHGQAYSGK
ncbi:type IX secretion system periplasmic lipoprotein PorW/SprE [Flavitalea antarctica]